MAIFLEDNEYNMQPDSASGVAVEPKTGIPADLSNVIVSAAAQYNLDPAMLTGLLYQESRFNPKAVSPAGARGIAQFMPETAKEMRVDDPHEPVQAIFGGAEYLRKQIDYFNGDIEKGVAAYNGGAGRVEKAVRGGGSNWRNLLPKETREYPGYVAYWQEAFSDHFKTQEPPAEVKQPEAEKPPEAKKRDAMADIGGFIDPIAGESFYTQSAGNTPANEYAAIDTPQRRAYQANFVKLNSEISGAPSQEAIDFTMAEYDKRIHSDRIAEKNKAEYKKQKDADLDSRFTDQAERGAAKAFEDRLNRRLSTGGARKSVGDGYDPYGEAIAAKNTQKQYDENRESVIGQQVASDMNPIVRGLVKGGMQSVALTGGALGYLGDLTEVKSLRDAGLDIYDKYMRHAGNMTKAKEFTEIDGASDAATWLAENAGYTAYQAAEALISSGVGGAIGKQIGKEALTGLAFMAANNMRQEFGSVYGDAVQYAKETGKPIPSLAQIAIGATNAMLVDTFADKLGVDAAKGANPFKGNLPVRMGKSLSAQLATQGGTEAVQLMHEDWGAGKPAPTIKDMVNEAAVGALGGFGPGVAGGVGKRSQNGIREIDSAGAAQPTATEVARAGDIPALSKASITPVAVPSIVAQQSAVLGLEGNPGEQLASREYPQVGVSKASVSGFSGMNELADMAAAERNDQAKRLYDIQRDSKAELIALVESERADQGDRIREALRGQMVQQVMQSREIAESDNRVRAAMETKTANARAAMLDSVMDTEKTPAQNARAFTRVLEQNGYRDTKPTMAEQERINRASGIAQTFADTPIPSSPNELVNAVQERKSVQRSYKDRVVGLLSQGFVRQGRRMVRGDDSVNLDKQEYVYLKNREAAKRNADGEFADLVSQERQDKSARLVAEVARLRGLRQPVEVAPQTANDAALPALRSAETKQPWQMTRAEVGNSLNAKGRKSAKGVLVVAPSPGSGLYETTHQAKHDVYLHEDEAGQYIRDYNETAHRRHVEYAIAHGKPVPDSVLAEYPDLQGADKPKTLPEQTNKPGMDAIKKAKADRNAQHIEGGESEPATAPVIAKSIKKSADNTPMDLRQAKADLLKQIDAAIVSAPDGWAIASDIPRGQVRGAKQDIKDRRDIQKEPVSPVTFDVPGDGKFTVGNAKENLKRFREEVGKSVGFNPPTKRKEPSRSVPGNPQTTIREMLSDGELLNAYELAKLNDTPLRFGNADKEGVPAVVYTNAKDADFGLGLKGFIGRDIKGVWRAIEETTGRALGSGNSPVSAMADTKKKFSERTPEQVKQIVGKAEKASQSELEAKWLEWAREREGVTVENPVDASSEDSAAQEVTPESNQDQEPTESQATAILDAVDVRGKDRLDIIAKVRAGEYSIDDLKAAYPAKAQDELPNGWTYQNGKGAAKEQFYVADANGEMLGNLKPTKAEALADANKQEEARRHYAAQQAQNEAAHQRVADKARAGEAITQADLDSIGLKADSRFDFISPAIQRLFGIHARKVREAIGDALRKGQGVYGGEIEVANAAKAIRNAAQYVRFTTDGDGYNGASQEIRRAAKDDEWPGDVRLDDGKYAPFPLVVRIAKEGIESGAIPAQPAQLNLRLGLAMRDVDRVLAAAQVTDSDTTDSATTTAKIGDFGEKLGGARKDVWATFRDSLGRVSDDDIRNQPLSKVWPAPDYQALIDGGMDKEIVAFVRAARDEIPSKPRASWKVSQWAEQVKTLKNFAVAVMDGEESIADVRQKMTAVRSIAGFLGRMTLYMEVGHAKSLEGITFQWQHYTLYKGEKDVSMWVVEGRPVSTALSNWPREIATGKTKEEALANFKVKYNSIDGEKEVRKAAFDIYVEKGKDGRKGFFVGKKVGRNIAELAGPFDAIKDAREFRDNNVDELNSRLDRFKEIPRERRDTNEPRVGEDMRNGQDVTPEMFSEAFGFRGVEFGNWVEQGKRQKDLNEAYDALMDMAAILGIPPKAISLNGELGLAFGARGKGGINPAAAHYEGDYVAINLTKKDGAGSLGHEWFHALDHYFSRMRKRGDENMTTALDVSLAARGSNFVNDAAVRREMIEAFGAVVRAIKNTATKARSSKLDGKRSKEYWITGHEMAARAFESYLISKLQDQNASNDYLANIVDEKTWEAAAALGFELDGSYPYPTAGEMPVIREGFDKFFSTIKTEETDKGVRLYSLSAMKSVEANIARGTDGFPVASNAANDTLKATHKTADSSDGNVVAGNSLNIAQDSIAGVAQSQIDSTHTPESFRASFAPALNGLSKGLGDALLSKVSIINEADIPAGVGSQQKMVRDNIPSMPDFDTASGKQSSIASDAEHGGAKEYGLSRAAYSFARDIKDIIYGDDEYRFYGFRGTYKSDRAVVGSELENSFLWDFENDTPSKKRAKGTSTIGIDFSGSDVDIEDILSAANNVTSYGDGKIVLVKGDHVGYGDGDNGESLISNATVVRTYDKGEIKSIIANKTAGIDPHAANNGQLDTLYSKEGKILAFVDTDSTINFVADNLPVDMTDSDIVGLAKHEIAVHAVKMGRNDREFHGILRTLDRMRDEGNKDALTAFAQVPSDTLAMYTTEEALGYLVQSNPKLGIVRRFISWLRQAIRNLGKGMPVNLRSKWFGFVDSTLTVEDLHLMAEQALIRSANEMGYTSSADNLRQREMDSDMAVEGLPIRYSKEPDAFKNKEMTEQEKIDAKNRLGQLNQSSAREGGSAFHVLPDTNNKDIAIAREVDKTSNAPPANVGGSPEFDGATRGEGWSIGENTKKERFIRQVQDKHIDTKRVQEAIEATRGKIDDNWNVYLQETLYHGRSARRVTDFINREVKPLQREILTRAVDPAEFEQFLWMRHAETRNNIIAERNPNMPDGGSGVSTKDARKYLAGLTNQQREDFTALAEKVDSIIAETRRLYVEYGLETADTVNGWANAMPDYVPLHREDNATSPGTGQGYSVRGSSVKSALGSSKKVADILANIVMERERAVVRGEKNRVSVALYGLAITSPNKDFWMPVNPGANPEKNAELLRSMGISDDLIDVISGTPTTRQLNKSTGQVEERANPALLMQDNVVALRVMGKDRFVVFNKNDERAMKMALALKNLDVDQLGTMLGGVAKVTRTFAAMNTQWNPVFGVFNFTRDMQDAMLNLSSTPIAGKQGEVTAHAMKALMGIYSDLRNERAGKEAKSSYAKEFEEFASEGGTTGYRESWKDSGARAEALMRELQRMSDGTAKKAGRAVFDWLSDYNEAAENAVRLAVYIVGKENGLSNAQAAALGKEITVNFNRKGQATGMMGALYAFTNARVQGTARVWKTLSGPAGTKIILGGLTLGVLQALALSAAGMGDDEPPEFIKDKSTIIPLGSTGKYIAIPMPLGYNYIPAIGRKLTELALRGGKNPGKTAFGILEALMDGLNPMGSSTMAQTLAPTIADPLISIAENKNWNGQPIHKEDRSSLNPTPGYTRFKDSASGLGKVVAKAINYLTSGFDNYKKGYLSPTPDDIDYLISQATGGVGKEAVRTWTVASGVYNGEDVPAYKVPLFGRLYGNTKEPAAEASKFYKNLTEINQHEYAVKERIKNKENPSEYIKDNPDAKLYESANRIEREISQLNQKKRLMVEKDVPRERVKVLEMAINARMKRFNDVVEKYRATSTQQK